MIQHVTEHGYGTTRGSQLLIFARAGVEYRTGGPLPRWDIVPSALMPAWISGVRLSRPSVQPSTSTGHPRGT
jgi:hypothetical protein